MLGLGISLLSSNSLVLKLGDKISKLFKTEGYTLLSKDCNRNLALLMNDPNNYYFEYTKIRSLFNTASFTELDTTCSYNLTKQIL